MWSNKQYALHYFVASTIFQHQTSKENTIEYLHQISFKRFDTFKLEKIVNSVQLIFLLKENFFIIERRDKLAGGNN